MNLQDLESLTIKGLSTHLPMSSLINACEKMCESLESGTEFYQRAFEILRSSGVPESEIIEGLTGIQSFLRPQSLKEKLKRELGEEDPFSLRRIEFKTTAFEGWSPLGLLVHVTPANVWTVGFLSVIEGLLAGNVNLLKLSSSDSDFAIHAINELGKHEPTGALKSRMLVARIPSSDKARMKEMLSHADGVAAWGGEEAIRSLKEMTPEGARFIDWGPKISFAYFTKGSVSQDEISKLVREVCDGDQQACSAPQCVYLEDASSEELKVFGLKLAQEFEKVSADIPGRSPDRAELSEITVVTRMQELKKAMGEGDVLKGDGWRILIDGKSSLRPSPLYRTLWLKAIKRDEIIGTLRPLRRYLQTVGLAVAPSEANELTRVLYTAGVLRVTPMGSMMGSYEGEPHDGVFALTRYARRVSMRGDERFESIGRLEELAPVKASHLSGHIMDKEDFQSMEVPSAFADLTFRSGGSSGTPKFSRFTYSDYHAQMRLAGYGLVAAGLVPATDRCMNLFFGGGLYGGFISFFSVLESLKAIQFPMAALPDHLAVGESIITHKVDTLLGMPSYLVQLFAENDELFKKHRPIKKIFYGGEHFQESQKRHLIATYGVELVKSAAYGSVDAGPLGYQCKTMSGSEHHLHHDAHEFEVVDINEDQAAEMGRLLVTTHLRAGQTIRRYDLGDLVRILPGECGCGRPGMRVELLGRHGDVVRVGSSFFNYARMARILAEEAGYAGEMQLIINPPHSGLDKEEIVFVLDAKLAPTDEIVEKVMNEYEPDFHEAVMLDKVLKWKVKRVGTSEMERVKGSGKLIHVIDRRHP